MAAGCDRGRLFAPAWPAAAEDLALSGGTIRAYGPVHPATMWGRHLGGRAVPTKLTMTFTLMNQLDSTADILVAHSQDTTTPLPITMPSSPDGVTRVQYPTSTAYSALDVQSGHGLTFSLDYEGGAGAAMDYWFAAVLVHGGRTPGSFYVGGTVQSPTSELKIPDSGQVSASLQQDPQFAAPMLSMGADYSGGSHAGGMSVMTSVPATPADPPFFDPHHRTGQEPITADLGEQPPPQGDDVGPIQAAPADPAEVDPTEASTQEDDATAG